MLALNSHTVEWTNEVEQPRHSMNGPRWWTEDEVEQLKKLRFEYGLTINQIAVRLNRTYHSVLRKYQIIAGIRQDRNDYAQQFAYGEHTPHPRYWTRNNDKQLLELWDNENLTTHQIAERTPNRSHFCNLSPITISWSHQMSQTHALGRFFRF